MGSLRKNFLKGGGYWGRGYDSAVEHLPRMWEALGSVSNTTPKNKTNKFGAGVETCLCTEHIQTIYLPLFPPLYSIVTVSTTFTLDSALQAIWGICRWRKGLGPGFPLCSPCPQYNKDKVGQEDGSVTKGLLI